MRRDGQVPYGQDGYVIGLREGRIKNIVLATNKQFGDKQAVDRQA